MYYLKPGDVTILGVSGQKSNGKSELTRVAVEEFGFIPMSLARHFKVDAVVKDGMPIHEVFGAHKSPETRDVLQRLGSDESRDVFGEDVWVQHLEAHLYDLVEHGARRVVVSDVRFPNEVKWIQRLGGRVYRVFGRRPQVMEGHFSELALNGWGFAAPDGTKGFDRLVGNHGTLEFLQTTTRTYIRQDFKLPG